MEDEGVLIQLISGLFVSTFQCEITEADEGERREFAIGLCNDDGVILRFGFFAIACDVEKIRECEQSLCITGMGLEVRRELLQCFLGIFGFSLIDEQFCFGEECVPSRDGAGVFDHYGIESGDFPFCRGGGEGLRCFDVLLFPQLRSHQNPTENDCGDCDPGEDLCPVSVDCIDHATCLTGGEGIEIVGMFGF